MSGVDSKRDDARIGSVLGGYRLTGSLGAGGMGIVYRAVDVGTGREVALKLLRAAVADDEDRRKRFLREARLAATLDHPSIVRVHEVGDVDGTIFIAMELVEGENLRSWIEAARDTSDRPSVTDVVALAREMASAVQYAHQKGIIHRDLKPDNVMVIAGPATPRVRVLDFGLAKLREIEGGALYQAETETNLTNDGRVLGTPGYMAPEQASGKEVGFPADVFAMGAMLYEMLTATRAFVGDSPMDVIVAVTRDDPPAPSSKNPAVGAELESLVMRCLAKAPSARPTMAEVTTTLARPSMLEIGSARGTRRVSRSLVLGGVLALALAASGTKAFLSSRAITADAHTSAGTLASSAPAGAGAAAPIPTAVTDLPPPASSVPEALALYKKAVSDERDGAEDAAEEELEQATKLDPELAAAHLRIAVRRATLEAQGARAHFASAVKYRERLTPRDRELLDATQPLFQQDPADMEGWKRNMEALGARYPADAEMTYEVGAMRNIQGDFKGAEEALTRAVTLDPRFGLGWAGLAEQQAYLGEFDASRATVARCLQVEPSASWCMWVREFVDGQEGRCSATEASARQRIAMDPSISDGYKALALALGALGRPLPLVQEAVDQAVARSRDPFGKRRLALNMGIRLALIEGDLVTAAKLAQELRTHVAARSDVSDHAAATFLSAEVETEAGRPERAAEIVKAFLDRREAWQAPPAFHDYAMADDLTPAILPFARHTKGFSESDYTSTLDAWRARWDNGLRGDYRPYLWVYGYAAPVRTKEDAVLALASLPRYSPIPPFLCNGALPRASVGRTLWLGGREDEGIEQLTLASRQCDIAVRPVMWIHSHAWLAEALEKKGDVAGACKELDVVLAHWGSAKPRSVTADAARSRSRALGCATLQAEK